MKAQDVRIDMIVEVHCKDSKYFCDGQTFMVKGIVYQKGQYFVLSRQITDTGNVQDGISIDRVEPVKTELEKEIDNIKKEIGA